MYFRPLPRLTLFFLPMFAVLVALGVWQLERLQWKLGLIAEIDAHLHAPPLSLDEMLQLAPNDAQYRRVALAGRYANSDEAYVFATADNGAPAYHVITPLLLDDGRVMLIDRGAVPPELMEKAKRRAGLLHGEQQVVGVWRTPDASGLFTPRPDAAHRIWYARDVAGIAKADAIKPAAPVIVEADAAPVPGGWPRGGQTVVTLRNDHLQYAITWFLLAGSLVVVYLAYHRAQGRLGLRR